MAISREYYYNHQLRKYLVQFMAIFADMKVQVGWTDDKQPRLISVPIINASKDRVVASIKGENTQNKPIRLPIMSAQLVGLNQAPDARKGVAGTRRKAFAPTGGLFPDDIKVVEQRMPVPYTAQLELGIWASNQDQHYQLLEQITMLFDPDLQFQRSDEVFDWTRISRVEMEDIRFDENVPSGGDRRLIQTFIGFTMPVYIAVPADVHQRYVKDIFMRIGMVGTDAETSFDIVQELDEAGVEYEHIFSLGDIEIDPENG